MLIGSGIAQSGIRPTDEQSDRSTGTVRLVFPEDARAEQLRRQLHWVNTPIVLMDRRAP